MRVATKPMNRDAVQAANAKTAKTYSPTPAPGDPNYGEFRTAWMDSYVEAGGACKQETKSERKKRVASDREMAESRMATRGAVSGCPQGQQQKQQQKKASSQSPSQPQLKVNPAPPPPANSENCPCKLSALAVTCGHGRSAKDDLLMVVADNALGDKITVSPTASGDCASKLVKRADGKTGFPSKGAGAADFRAEGKSTGGYGVLSLYKARSIDTFVSADACGTSVRIIKVSAYPPGKNSAKLNVKELKEKYEGILAYLPINLGGEREPVRPIKTPKDPNWEKKGYGVTVSTAAQWKEDDDSHRACCGMSLSGGFDPVIATGASYPLYGVPIPPKLQRYLRAGIYLNIDFAITFGATCEWEYWPDVDSAVWNSFQIELAGGGSIELAAELLVCSPDVMQAKAAAKSEMAVKGWGEKVANTSPAVKGNAECAPLTATIVFSMAWGLIETSRDWSVFSTIKTDDIEYVFE